MANNAVKISAHASCTAPSSTDAMVLASNTAGNTQTLQVSVNDILSNSDVNAEFVSVAVTSNTTPANNSDNSSRPAHSFWADGDYIYYYDGTEIKRAALTTF